MFGKRKSSSSYVDFSNLVASQITASGKYIYVDVDNSTHTKLGLVVGDFYTVKFGELDDEELSEKSLRLKLIADECGYGSNMCFTFQV